MTLVTRFCPFLLLVQIDSTQMQNVVCPLRYVLDCVPEVVWVRPWKTPPVQLEHSKVVEMNPTVRDSFILHALSAPNVGFYLVSGYIDTTLLSLPDQ